MRRINLVAKIFAYIAEIKRLRVRIRILEQEVEALSALNRLSFAEKHGRQADTDDELMMHYVEMNGASTYAKTHKIDPTQDFCGETDDRQTNLNLEAD